jgi:large-conductance mechanosensitive channel
MQNTIAAVINLAIIAWLAHLTVEAVRQHKRRTDARRRS